MKAKLFILFVILSMASAVALGVPKTSAAQNEVVLGEAITITVQVVAIDKKDRHLALLGPKGDVVVVEVSEEAKNFDQIKVGDRVKVKHYKSVAIFLGKPGQQPDIDAGMIVARPPKGEAPAVYKIGAVDAIVSVRAIDRANRTVTLKGPEGNIVTTRVDKSVKAYDTLKVGDSIHVRYTEAIAITVEKP